jgi:hypothetical protein
MAASMSVAVASDQGAIPVSLSAGENHIGKFGGEQFESILVPTVSTSPQYTAGDIVGGLLTFTNVGRVANGKVSLQTVEVTIKSNVTPNMRLILFSADPTSTTKTDNAALAVNAADVFKLRGSIGIAGWVNLNTAKFAQATGIARPYTTDASNNLYAILVDDTGVTLGTTTDVQVRIAGYQE